MDRVLLIDDEADVQYSFRRILEGAGVELATAATGEEGLRLLPVVQPDLVIMDIRMAGLGGLETLRRMRQAEPHLPIIMMTAYGTTQTAIEAMKLGAFDYLLKPFDVPRLKEVISAALRARHEDRGIAPARPEEPDDSSEGIVGRSEAMQNVYKLIGQLAGSDATVLVTGESGTGKELVARAIAQHSRRSREPFLAINCAAIPEQLLESELFGHEKGAFTGAASQRLGKFELCNHGTIFLDEIGDMSLTTQTKILRVLQSGSFERVGANHPIQVDVRVIAATNRPLEQAIRAREFREDLFYRLNVVRIHLPALRERPEDIPLLVQHFLRKHLSHQRLAPVSASASTLEVLRRHAWPGNVRELENVIQRAMVVAKSGTILPDHLPPELRQQPALASDDRSGLTVRADSPASPEPAGAALPRLALELFAWAKTQPSLKVLPAVERELVICALAETNGNQVRAARLLGITRATLRKRIEKFGIRLGLVVH